MLMTLAACNSQSADRMQPLSPQQFPHIAMVEIRVNSGDITLMQSSSNQVEITGLAPVDLTIQQFEQRLEISAEDGEVDLKVSAPAGIEIDIESFDADGDISDFEGQVKVNSEAGELNVTNFKGDGLFRSGRGDILITDSQGKITLLGEHGLLQLTQVYGSLSATTIMGTVQYIGQPGEGDDIQLETDHGPVEVRLQPASSVVVKNSSSGGKVLCLASALFENGQNCSGNTGLGEGKISIRTVSGDIAISTMP